MSCRESESLANEDPELAPLIREVQRYFFKNPGASVGAQHIATLLPANPNAVTSALDHLVSLGQVSMCSEVECPECAARCDLQEYRQARDDEDTCCCTICGCDLAEFELNPISIYRPNPTFVGKRRPALEPVKGIHEIIGCHSARRMDVVFVHGLDGHWKETWHPKNDPNCYWPEWLGQDTEGLGVWSVNYDASASGWLGSTMPLIDRAKNLLEGLKLAGIGDRPLVFVAHSLGGLVVKQMLRTGLDGTDSRCAELSRQTTGIVFIATPHKGSDLAKWPKWFPGFRRTATVKELERHAPALRDLDDWFRKHATVNKLSVRSFAENERVGVVTVVDKDSANPGISGAEPICIDADHIEIAKSSDRTEIVYLSTREFIQGLIEAAA